MLKAIGRVVGPASPFEEFQHRYHAGGLVAVDAAKQPHVCERRNPRDHVHAQQIEAKLGDRVSRQPEFRRVARCGDPRDDLVIACWWLH